MITQVIVNGFITGLLYALVALGFNIIYSGLRVFHIAHGAVYTATCYFLLLWLGVFGMSWMEASMYMKTVSLVFTFGSICILAVLLEKINYHPLLKKKAPPLVSFISSFGAYLILINIIAWLYGNEIKLINPQVEETYKIGDFILTQIQILQFLISSLSLVFAFFLIHKTPLGSQIRALASNSLLAKVIGLDIKAIRLKIIILGSLLAAIPALLRGLDVGVDPYVGMANVLVAVVAFILGGVFSMTGTVIAAVFLGVVQNLSTWFFSAQWQEAITFIILLCVLLVRREGILSVHARLEEQ